MKGYFRKRGCRCPKGKRCYCDATWSFTLDIGTDPVTGKRKQKTGSGYRTKAEADIACAEMITEYERGNLSASSKNETVESFMKNYLDTVLKNEIETHSYDNKVAIMNRHVTPEIGKIKLSKLTPMHVQKFINHLIEKKLSAGTIQNIMRLVNQTLSKAVAWGYIVKNPATFSSKPPYKPEKFEVWNKEQFEVFLQSSKESRFYPFYLIALSTGMRPGEITALSWDMVDTKANTIRVERNTVWTKDKGIHIKTTPKNESSRRTITVPDSVMKYLKKLKLMQKPNELNLVIPGVKNPIVYNSALTKVFNDDILKAQLPKIKLHSLRHTHATYLLSPAPFGLGQSIKAVSERLGHAKTTTTLNTYAHVLPNMQESLAEQFDKALSFSL